MAACPGARDGDWVCYCTQRCKHPFPEVPGTITLLLCSIKAVLLCAEELGPEGRKERVNIPVEASGWDITYARSASTLLQCQVGLTGML